MVEGEEYWSPHLDSTATRGRGGGGAWLRASSPVALRGGFLRLSLSPVPQLLLSDALLAHEADDPQLLGGLV